MAKRRTYDDVLQALHAKASPWEQESANEFDPRPYENRAYDLSKMGLRWTPVIACVSTQGYDARSPWHCHRDCIEFVFSRRGVLKYESCSQVYSVLPGAVFVSRPNEMHRLLTEDRRLLHSTLHVSTRRDDWRASGFGILEWKWMMTKLKNLPRTYNGGTAIEKGFRKVFWLAGNATMSNAERKIRLHAAAQRLVLDLIDIANAPKVQSRNVIRMIVGEIGNHPERLLSMDDLVDRLHMSPSGILNSFKAETGFAPHAFQLKCRVNRAMSLLLEGHTLEEASARLGFDSRQHLSSTFRRFIGVSPRDWLKTHRKT